jgi:hypothetical protein
LTGQVDTADQVLKDFNQKAYEAKTNGKKVKIRI